MFCYQCEQTAKGQGCDKVGVCGKQPDVAALHNLLMYALKGLSLVAIEGRKVGISDSNVNRFTCEAMFATLTNVDFDPERIVALINNCIELREGLKAKVKEANGKTDFSEMVTRAFGFSGTRLNVNMESAMQEATGAGTCDVRVEILTPNHEPIPGFTREDADPLNTTGTAHTAAWGGKSDLSDLKGKTIKLRFYFRNAKLNSFQFTRG